MNLKIVKFFNKYWNNKLNFELKINNLRNKLNKYKKNKYKYKMMIPLYDKIMNNGLTPREGWASFTSLTRVFIPCTDPLFFMYDK